MNGETPGHGGNGHAAPAAPAPAAARDDEDGERVAQEEFDDEEDDLENSLSLAAMEAELRPPMTSSRPRTAACIRDRW